MKLRLLLVLSLIILLAYAGHWLRQEWRIDSCLDNGGRWNALQTSCEGA